jgi:hypothetical protein
VENDKPGFDVNTTIHWATGVLKDPDGTAAAYRETRAPWQRTFIQITLPVYVAAAVAGFILSLVFGRPFMYGATAGAPLFFLFSLVWSVAFVFVAVFIFDFFAGVFQGKRDYDAAFAALSLAMIPAALGGVFSPLPWLGWLLSLAASIYGLVLIYRFIPVFMTVPEDKRVVHFVVSLIVAFVVNLVVAGLLGVMFGPDLADYTRDADIGTEGSGGIFTDFERQANVAEEASRDRYDPPNDGRITENQVTAYVRTLQRTAELRERLGSKFENVDEDNASIGAIFSGIKDAARLGTAEMEVVKTAGGNWAEHQWVKNQIETARVQQDSTPAVEHNYELFLEYQEQIEQYE